MDFKGLAFALANGWVSGAAGILTMHPMDTVRGNYLSLVVVRFNFEGEGSRINAVLGLKIDLIHSLSNL